ncbi:MAG: acetate--CoA ligase family protein, partial [Acidimicrobiaceae bacterium]|nr:acetate--CoA ligase family protein [Acidimicrobiaceae bacterium]
MEIHEYQAKAILADYGVSIPDGGLAYSPEQATYRASEIGGERWVVKAQIHSGARGQAGGIKLCNNEREVWEAADELLGKRLVTHQTGERGKGVYRLYVEAAVAAEREIYLGFVLDRSAERVMVVASASGGMAIEEIAARDPDAIVRVNVEPAVGLQAFEAREIAFAVGLDASLVPQAAQMMTGCYRIFGELDATMLEINPLAVTGDGRLLALDAKMTFDDNALPRLDSIGERRAWRTYATAAIRNAVEARNAMRQEAYVAGGIAAPSLQGAMPPTSPVSDARALGPEAYRREWTDHAKLLADEGADLILAEYVGFIEDCVEAVDGCAEAGVPVFLGVRHIQDDSAMQYGESLIDLASALAGHPVD